MTKKFNGQIQRVVHVATVNEVNLMLFGVLFCGETEWLRLCTTEILDAETIAFLNPGSFVQITIGETIVVEKSRYHKIDEIMAG